MTSPPVKRRTSEEDRGVIRPRKRTRSLNTNHKRNSNKLSSLGMHDASVYNTYIYIYIYIYIYAHFRAAWRWAKKLGGWQRFAEVDAVDAGGSKEVHMLEDPPPLVVTNLLS